MYYEHILKGSTNDDIQGVGYVTAEKQSPSALDLLGAMSQAVATERRLASARPGSSKALKDLLGKCISEFNAKITNKKHRIDTHRKNLIYNLMLTSSEVLFKKHFQLLFTKTLCVVWPHFFGLTEYTLRTC